MYFCSSAGIGRTGTFIALDYLLKEVMTKDSIDVINCVSKLRQQRAFSIQTDVRESFLVSNIFFFLLFTMFVLVLSIKYFFPTDAVCVPTRSDCSRSHPSWLSYWALPWGRWNVTNENNLGLTLNFQTGMIPTTKGFSRSLRRY